MGTKESVQHVQSELVRNVKYHIDYEAGTGKVSSQWLGRKYHH